MYSTKVLLRKQYKMDSKHTAVKIFVMFTSFLPSSLSEKFLISSIKFYNCALKNSRYDENALMFFCRPRAQRRSLCLSLPYSIPVMVLQKLVFIPLLDKNVLQAPHPFQASVVQSLGLSAYQANYLKVILDNRRSESQFNFTHITFGVFMNT